ncbi:MAG: magnesium transporter [Desulfobaccales bacterium]
MMKRGEPPLNQGYPPETAGRVMTVRVPVVRPEATLADIERLLLKQAKAFDSISYVYVVDQTGRLQGVISIKEVFQQGKHTPATQVMTTSLVTASPLDDQERVVHLALGHNLRAVPLVDDKGLFCGVVLSKALLHTLYQEASEDMLRLVGIKRSAFMFDNVLQLSILKSLEHRTPWLFLGLMGGMLAAGIIGQFEHTLQQNLILAAFIPLMVYMADAVGTQMEAFIIRDLAVNPNLDFGHYLLRQMLIVGLIGIASSLLLLALVLLLYRTAQVGLVLAMSLFLAIFSSVLTGLVVPYGFGKLRLDPANASGPVATIIQDIFSVTILFLVASWLL